MVYRGMRHILWRSSCKYASIIKKWTRPATIAATKMRKGHDFHKDRGGGNCQPWPMRGKPICLLPLFYSNHFHYERLLVVEGVNGFGEWGGRTVSPHPHAHSTSKKHSRTLQFWGFSPFLLFITHAGIFPLSPRLCNNAHALAICVPSIVVHSHAEGFFPVFRLHTQNLLGFTHVVSSPMDLRMMWSYPIPTGRLWVRHCCSRSSTG